jgi:hypothetical protein
MAIAAYSAPRIMPDINTRTGKTLKGTKAGETQCSIIPAKHIRAAITDVIANFLVFITCPPLIVNLLILI